MRHIITILSLFVALSASAADKPLNFVLLLVDDLGYGDIGYTGNDMAETPHIDSLIESGMWFANGYAPAAQCSPTRASILSGQYPGRLHLTTWIPKAGGNSTSYRPEYNGIKLKKSRHALPLEIVTIAERLKNAGYRTINLGKWHIGHEGFEPKDQGFDEQPGWWPWSFPKTWFAPFKLETLKDYPKGTYMTDALTDEAIRFVNENRDTPFFMAFQYYTVHSPLKGKPEFLETTLAAGAKQGKKSGYPNADFEAMKMSLDENVGRLLEALDLENTVVIFTSDNGGVARWARNTPYRAGKKHLYEGGIHVPLSIYWPELTEAGSVTHEPVSAMDLYPTIVDALGIDTADGQVMDGESLLEILGDSNALLKREALFWHFPDMSYEGSVAVSPRGVVRLRDYKLIKPYHPEEEPELYNLKNDPSESTDLAATHPEVVQRLTAMLREHISETEALMPTPNSLF